MLLGGPFRRVDLLVRARHPARPLRLFLALKGKLRSTLGVHFLSFRDYNCVRWAYVEAAVFRTLGFLRIFAGGVMCAFVSSRGLVSGPAAEVTVVDGVTLNKMNRLWS